MDNTEFIEYLYNEINQCIKICKKYRNKAENNHDLTELVKMEAKLDAYVYIWSLFDRKVPDEEINLQD